jgi:hypothetical protein
MENSDLILGGDFMISNASIECCKLEKMELIRLLCKVIQSFAWSGIERINGKVSSSRSLAYGFEGIAVLANEDAKLAHKIGHTLSQALTLVEDVSNFCQESLAAPSRLADYANLKITDLNSFEARESIVRTESLAKVRNEALDLIEKAMDMVSFLPAN